MRGVVGHIEKQLTTSAPAGCGRSSGKLTVLTSHMNVWLFFLTREEETKAGSRCTVGLTPEIPYYA